MCGGKSVPLIQDEGKVQNSHLLENKIGSSQKKYGAEEADFHLNLLRWSERVSFENKVWSERRSGGGSSPAAAVWSSLVCGGVFCFLTKGTRARRGNFGAFLLCVDCGLCMI